MEAYKEILPVMQKVLRAKQLNMVRAQKAIRPTKEQIDNAVQLANEKYRNGHKQYFPEVYTR